MQSITRRSIFEQAAKKLRQEFDELTTVPHNALKGSEAEQLVRKFLGDHIPKRFAVGSGFIIDPHDTVSRQTDVVVYDSFNCPVYRASDSAGIFPSDNVAAVVEVKSSLNTAELEDCFEKISSVKRLSKHSVSGHGPERSQTLGCVFAFSCKLKPETLLQHYSRLLQSSGLGPHIDLLLLLDQAVITLACKVRGIPQWGPAFFEGIGGPAAEGSHIAASLSPTGEDSLDFFLRLLISHLSFFRHITDHPGFDWSRSKSGGLNLMQYITSITLETDPDKRNKRLKAYKEQARREFDRMNQKHKSIDL